MTFPEHFVWYISIATIFMIKNNQQYKVVIKAVHWQSHIKDHLQICFFLIFGDFIDKSNLICGFQLQTTSSVFFIKASKEYCSLSWSPALFIQIHSSFTRPGRKPNVLQNTVQHKYFQKGGNSIQKNLLGNNNCLNLAENRMVQEIQTMLNYETEKNTLDKYLK